ncbi:hypothetical protein HYC85_020228 [Camellia sinensis]|uniref:Prohibitin n=1 Tax=Camellia sinensis TaxID=4442 RepID=A0A7J7GSV0_CAMSI|nr:hypothetical protein HYC85_020228 [Camellia sinensis]
MVNLTLRVLSRPEVSQFSPNLPNPRPRIRREILKAVVAQFNVDQLFTERPSVSALVRESLVRRAKDFNIVLDDVAITHLSYGAEISKAVERRETERSKFVVAKAEQEIGFDRAAIIRTEVTTCSLKNHSLITHPSHPFKEYDCLKCLPLW